MKSRLLHTLLFLLFLALPSSPAAAQAAADPHAGHGHAAEAAKPEAGHGEDDGHGHGKAPEAAKPEAGHAEDDGHGHGKEPEAGHGEDDGHGHGESSPIHDKPFAEIAEADCEHKVKTVDCDKCRFEVGVVKLDPASKMFKFERPARSSAPATLDFPGECRLTADGVRVIAPRVPARLLSIAVRVGDAVVAGAPLAELESPELAAAALDCLKRSAEYSFAERRARRDAPLAEKRMITDQEFLDGRSAFELASLEVGLARKRLLMLGLDDASIDRLPVERDHPALLGRFTLRAPIAGRVTARDCEIGELVPTDHALLTVADLSRMWVVAQCHERDIAALRAALAAGAASVEIAVLATPGRTFPGRVFALDPAVSRETRTLPMWIEAENAEGLLAAGMFCRIGIALPGAADALTLPADAVLEDEGRNFVFLRGRGDLFVSRIVAARPLPGGRVAVTGLPADAEVVTTGAFLLKSDVLREKMGAGCAD